jgi:hypothetical protein
VKAGHPAFAGLLVALLMQASTAAHVGSADVFLEGFAGPYRLFVTVRPPIAIPGVADVEVLATTDDLRDVHIVPLPLAGQGAKFAPIPDQAARSKDDPRLFTGHLWLMNAGAWQVRVTVAGDKGEGTLSVPVPTLPQQTLGMTPALRVILFAFMMLLASGLVAIIAAMAREAKLGAGEALDARAKRRGRIAGAIASVAIAIVIFLGNMWWTAEATAYDRYVYKPLTATPTLTANTLRLDLHDPGWIGSRRMDDFVQDHGHLMHLFVLSPELDHFWHLHPAEIETGRFEQQLPSIPPGSYELFADVVHATGVPETITGGMVVGPPKGGPSQGAGPLQGDDSTWSYSEEENNEIEWVRDSAPLVSRKLTLFTFRVVDRNGQPATDLELYMGMPGHAVFVRRDRKVFAHVHPSGSAPMAAIDLAMPGANAHAQHQAATPSTVTFPYGFPSPGQYKIFVQVKRAGAVITGAFDADVK